MFFESIIGLFVIRLFNTKTKLKTFESLVQLWQNSLDVSRIEVSAPYITKMAQLLPIIMIEISAGYALGIITYCMMAVLFTM